MHDDPTRMTNLNLRVPRMFGSARVDLLLALQTRSPSSCSQNNAIPSIVGYLGRPARTLFSPAGLGPVWLQFRALPGHNMSRDLGLGTTWRLVIHAGPAQYHIRALQAVPACGLWLPNHHFIFLDFLPSISILQLNKLKSSHIQTYTCTY